MLHEETTEKILAASFDVINELGSGFLEHVYERAMIVALRDRGARAATQVPYQIHFREVVVGDYVADLIVDDAVLVELKAAKALLPEHQAQVINYLKAAKIDVGLLINFGNPKLEYKRLHR